MGEEGVRIVRTPGLKLAIPGERCGCVSVETRLGENADPGLTEFACLDAVVLAGPGGHRCLLPGRCGEVAQIVSEPENRLSARGDRHDDVTADALDVGETLVDVLPSDAETLSQLVAELRT